MVKEEAFPLKRAGLSPRRSLLAKVQLGLADLAYSWQGWLQCSPYFIQCTLPVTIMIGLFSVHSNMYIRKCLQSLGYTKVLTLESMNVAK